MPSTELTPQQRFIVQLYPAAREVARETGMSWELILAQAAQETGWGQKVLPGTNNIFNIKASPGWEGPARTFNVWEIESGRKVWKHQDFRVYSKVEESLRDRVAFLRENPRYARSGLFDDGVKGDLRREAGALQRAGYATDPEYASNLVRVFHGRTMQSAIAHAEGRNLSLHERVATEHEARVPMSPVRRAQASAIYDEAYHHFLGGRHQYEYGRPDQGFRNRGGNYRTDSSRTERDGDGDGRRGVDCSSFVWRGLRNAGYAVPTQPFSTHALFIGTNATAYARENFDVVPAAEARRDGGSLQAGDILMFRNKVSQGQHVGIFKGYDGNGRIEFIGSQVTTGPALVTAGRGTYWNGGDFEIVGALRAKPEFQVRAPLSAGRSVSPGEGTSPPDTAPQSERSSQARSRAGVRRAEADGMLQFGEKGPAVASLQHRLADLGYRGKDGRPLRIDADFGDHTKFALQAFQREHGLEGKGVAGPRTATALDRAERALMTHPSHPHHALYAQVLEQVHAEERAKGQQPGHHSQRIAAALAVECLREGITRVDRVELNRDVSIVRGVQVGAVRDEPGLNRTTDGISVAQAAQQTLRESSEQIHQVAVNRQAQERDEQQRQARPAPAMTP